MDCLTTGQELTDWTTLTAAASISISVTPTHNAIQNAGNKHERKQLTVDADRTLSTETRDARVWDVENIREYS